MAGRGAPTAIVPSRVRWCRPRRQGRMARSDAPAATDRLAPMPRAIAPAARLRPRPDAENFGGEVSWRATRQAHREYRTLARLARHGHVATHHARELTGDGKAKTGAAEALRGRGISLAELLEQLRLLLRRHAHAGIDHR